MYRVSGKTSIDDVNELLGWSFPTRSGTRSPGSCSTSSDASRTRARSTRIDGLTFRTEEVKGRRIETVLITRDTEKEPELVEGATS